MTESTEILAENTKIETNSSSSIDFAAYNIESLTTPEQRKQIQELHDSLQQDSTLKSTDGSSLPAWISPGTLLRYLEAHKWDATKSHAAIQHTNQWRNEAKIDELKPDTDFIASNRALKGSYCIGRGYENEVICYIAPVNNPHTFEEKRLYSIWMLEEALRHVQEPKQRSTIWLLDFSGMSGSTEEHVSKDKDRRKLSRESMRMVSEHYPETLKRMFFINPPFFFRLIWKFLSFFIEKTTYEKIQIVTGTAEQIGPELTKVIPKEQLSDTYGGSLRITDRMKEEWFKLLDTGKFNENEDEAMD